MKELKECWINVYEYHDGSYFNGFVHRSKEEAIKWIARNHYKHVYRIHAKLK